MLAIRFWSLLFVVVAALWWWATRTHAGSWWWAAVLNVIPPQILLPLPLWLAWRAMKAKKRGWVLLNLAAAALFTVSTVGFVLPKAAKPQMQSDVPLTLMTLNANYASASPAHLAEIALREGVQVLTLQEGLNKSFSAEPYQSELRAAFPNWTLVRHDELLTLSRLPVLKSQVVKFPNTPHAVLVTWLRDEGQTVMVVNTHLPTLSLMPNSSDKVLGRDLPERIGHGLSIRRDFQQMVAGLLRQNAGPLVLAGDLNTPARGGVVNQLRFLKLRDAFAEGGSGFGFTHYALPLMGHSRIDYVWVRDLQVVRANVQRDLLSDHRAYVVRLSVPAPVDETSGAGESGKPDDGK